MRLVTLAQDAIEVAMKTIANLGNHFMNTPLDEQFMAQRWEKD